MKRFMIFTLIFAILSCTAISLFAYNDKAKKTVNKYWAGCVAEDTDVPLSANANIEANIEYPGEPGIGNAVQNFFRGYGVEYYASASVSGKAPIGNDDYEGEYDLYASVCFDDDTKSNTWDGEVNEKVKADDFVKLDEDLTNWDFIRAIDELYPWADADVDGSSPEKSWQQWVNLNAGPKSNPDIAPNPYTSPSTDNWQLIDMYRPAQSTNAVADVWNFSFSDTTKWNCFQSGDTTCHECD